MNARELVKECEKKIGWKLMPESYRFRSINLPVVKLENWKLKPALYGFTDDFETIRNGLPFDELVDEKEIKKFIEICDNRIEHARTFLKDVATVLGFGITSLAIIFPLSSKLIEQGENVNPIADIFLTGKYGNLFKIFVAALIIGVIMLLALLIRYRTRIHAWTAFKEGAILNKKYQ